MRKYVPDETGLQRNVPRLRSGVICSDRWKWEGEDEPTIIANLQNTEKKDPGHAEHGGAILYSQN